MTSEYSENLIKFFMAPKNVFSIQDKYNFIGFAGDQSIGEYVQLYFDIDVNKNNFTESKIIQAKFSVIGGVSTIAIAEKFCSEIKELHLNEALKLCGEESKFLNDLKISQDKIYSSNFVFQAFYKIFEK